jgi:hypothetical protein
VIGGSAPTTAVVNSKYSFLPSASDPNGDALSFQIANKPAWATFNTVTGELTGTPTLGQLGTYADIIISASDGKGSAQLGPFSIKVSQTAANGAAAVTLAWEAPTQTEDGSPLTDLSGYLVQRRARQQRPSR